MNYPDPYPIRPFTGRLQGELSLPGSKSLTNRALVLAALADEPVTLDGALFSRDTEILCRALQDLGFAVEPNRAAASIRVEGRGGEIPNRRAHLQVGNAGTAARFLTALLALCPDGEFQLDGDVEMRRRPMAGLLDALQQQGARFSFAGEHGCFPFTMHTAGLVGGELELDARASSQMLSALMLVAPKARQPVVLRSRNTRPAFVRMTAGMLEQLGVAVECGDGVDSVRIDPTAGLRFAGSSYRVEPDLTASSYFLGLTALLGGELAIRGMPQQSLQGDIAFADLMESLGLEIDRRADHWRVACERPLNASGRFHMETFSDTFLTLAALAPALATEMQISGIAHTRFQETDRVQAMQTELQRLGQEVDAGEGELRIRTRTEALGSCAAEGVTVQTYRDHRIAMSFGILGCCDLLGDGRPWLSVADPACCGKTFPDFFDKLEQLRSCAENTK